MGIRNLGLDLLVLNCASGIESRKQFVIHVLVATLLDDHRTEHRTFKMLHSKRKQIPQGKK